MSEYTGKRTMFVRLDGKDSFVELDYGFYVESGKILMRFCKYNPQNNNKMDFTIPVYFDAAEFIGLYEKLKASRMWDYSRRLSYEKKINEVLYASYSGYGVQKTQTLKDKIPFPVGENEAVAKVFQVLPSMNKTYMLKASIMKGQELPTGAIKPIFNNPRYIQIPGDYEDIIGFLGMGVMRLQTLDMLRMQKTEGGH